MSLWQTLRGLYFQMFGYTNLKQVVGGDIALTREMVLSIERWANEYIGRAPWLSSSIKSNAIESGICREFRNVVLSEIETSLSDEQLDEVYQKAVDGLSKSLLRGLALGSFVIKPITDSTFEYVTADKFVPIKFGDDGKLLDAGFLTTFKKNENSYYTRFERHTMTEAGLIISNKCYHSAISSEIGRPCSFALVEQWQNIQEGEVLFPGMMSMDFGYYINPCDNKVDSTNCGVSIYADAEGLIAEADERAGQLDWEYKSGERAVHVDNKALRSTRDGVARLDKRLYRGLNLEAKDGELFKEYSPEIRDESYRRGYEDALRKIEFVVGLSYGDLSDTQQVDKTATEIKASKVRKFDQVKQIQDSLKNCLEDFARALAFQNGKLNSNYEFICNFHDSVLVDEEKEREQDKADVRDGIMSRAEYRAKWYGETIEEALERLPQIGGLLE